MKPGAGAILGGSREAPEAFGPAPKPLAVKALYIGERAAARGRYRSRPLQRVLDGDGRPRVLRVGRFLFVPLTELEEKFPPLWESIRTARAAPADVR